MKIKTPQSLNEVAASKSFSLLDKGSYPVRVLNYKDGVSKAGNAKVDLEMEVHSGPATGRKLFYNITPGSVAALPFVRQALEAFGVQWDDEGFDPVGFIGKTALANVDIDNDDPQNPRNVVKSVRKSA
jgi:hypothetical protein